MRRILALLQKPQWVFLILVIPIGILSALWVPQLSVNDENNHFLRAYNIASGSLGNHNCHFPAAIADKAEATYKRNYTTAYTSKVNFSANEKYSCGSAATYSPLMHLPQAVGIFLAKLLYPSAGFMVLLGRLANLAFYTVALYFIIKYARIGKWAFVVIGLFPLSVHIAASLSADVMNNIIVLGFMAFMFNLFTQKGVISRMQSGILIMLAGLLALSKVTNVLLLLPLLFLPARSFAANRYKRVPFSIHKWLLGLGSIVIGALGLLAWQKLYHGSIISVHTPPPVNPLEHNPLHFVTILYATYINPFIGYTDVFFLGLIGQFSSYQYHLPLFIFVLDMLLFFIVLLHRDPQEEKLVQPIALRLGISSVVSLMLLVVAVTYAMYTTWAIQPFRLGANAPYADGVQGRYFLAALISLVPFFVWLRRGLSFETRAPSTIGLLVFSLSGASLLYYILETYKFVS